MENSEYEMFKEFHDIVGIEELCQMLHIGKSLAYRVVRSGEIKGKKLGRVVLIAKSDVIDFIKQDMSVQARAAEKTPQAEGKTE